MRDGCSNNKTLEGPGMSLDRLGLGQTGCNSLCEDLSEWRAAVSTYAKTNAIQGAYHTAVRGASRNASVSREEQRPQETLAQHAAI
eukprot:2153377-Amphidinium_carterae.2